MPSLKIGQRQASDPEGRMPLMDHLRELRGRLLKAAIGLAVCAVLVAVFFEPIWVFFREPFCRLQLMQQSEMSLPQQGDETGCGLVVNGIFEGFMLRLRLALILGLVGSAPVWLYQLWAFVAPGLHSRERRYTYIFLGASVPLFFAGATLAYFTMSKGLQLLIGLVPDGAVPLIRISEYLTYVTLLILIFGFSFLLPLLVTTLNFAGVLSHERLKKWRRWIVFGVCIFAAVATPSQDPVTMLVLAIPMALLMELATLIARYNDHRRARAAENAAYAQLGDDETSPLDLDDSSDTEETR